MTECCRPCHGQGRTRTRDSVALEVICAASSARRRRRPARRIVVRAAPEVVDWLEMHDEEVRRALARRGAARVQLRGARGICPRRLRCRHASLRTPRANAPICGKPQDAKFRPFCSKRCADIDLGRWLKGGYAIPAVEPPE